MAIGKRIRFFRNRKGMTQKQLGEILGFLGKTSDVRMAQYESEARTPKQNLVYVPRMAGAGCPSGTGRDNQRGIRPMEIQISRIRYFKSLEENCTLTRIK